MTNKDDKLAEDLKETTYYIGSDGDFKGANELLPYDENCTFEFYEETTEISESRGAWGGKLEFIFSCLSYAVGLGNVWRFPYLCYMNGGGAFLFPYIIMLAIVGAPMLYLETCLGQYSGSGPITAFRISPIFTGIGWSMILTTFFASIYYCMLIAWTVFYFLASFAKDVPWRKCAADWTDCVDVETQTLINKCRRDQGFRMQIGNQSECVVNSTCMHGSVTLDIFQDDKNVTNITQSLVDQYKNYLQTNMTMSNCSSEDWRFTFAQNLKENNLTSYLNDFLNQPHSIKTPSNEYFHRVMLDISDGISDLGAPRWQLALCLLGCWIIIGLCLIKGIRSAGKAVYFTALFPYFVLAILMVRGLTLEGSAKGLIYYFKPNWERLLDLKIWGDAAVQIFYSLSPCWGGIIALSSYNQFHNDALKDTIIVVIGDGLTSVFAGMVIFSVLGYMSEIMHVGIDQVVKQGTGLAFIVYPDIVTTMPISPLWALLFFAMLLTLGFGTMISNVNCIYTGVMDRWPQKFRKNKVRSVLLLVGICTTFFIMGLPCTTRGGIYVITLLDNYAASYSVLVIAFFELLVVGWLYGIDNFLKNIEDMEKRKPNLVTKIFLKYVTIIFLSFITIFKIIKQARSSYGEYTFPLTADILGGMLSFGIILPIPAFFIHHIFFDANSKKIREEFSNLPWYKVFLKLAGSHPYWGPRMGDKTKDQLMLRAESKSRLIDSQKNLIQSQTTLASSTINTHHRIL